MVRDRTSPTAPEAVPPGAPGPGRRGLLRGTVAGGVLAAFGLPLAARADGGAVHALRPGPPAGRPGTPTGGPAAGSGRVSSAVPGSGRPAPRRPAGARRPTRPTSAPASVSGQVGGTPGQVAPAAARPGVAADPAPGAARPGGRPPVLKGGRAADPMFTLHLLRRTTYGLTPELLADVAAAGGAAAWLERQLAPESIPDPVCDAVLTRFPLATATGPWCVANLPGGSWGSLWDVAWSALSRQVWSRRQLYEVMVDFWSNHLNITTPSSEVWATKATDDVQVVRAHALGRFDDMLVASMRSPAMLLYLSNAASTRTAPNENYGRELLELHTVGVDAGYGQDGVVDSARVLTGLTVWNPWDAVSADRKGTLRYRADWHWTGPVRVLGWSHPNGDPAGGVEVAESYGRYLAHHPATATRIATKLAVRFVSDDPPATLVATLARVYLDGDTAVVPVLRALFASPEFAAAAGRKYRRPAEDVIATVRALGVTPDPASSDPASIRNLYWPLQAMGNAPLGWHPPNGYPDVAPAWSGAGTTLGRWNMHLALTQTWWKPGLTYPDLLPRLVGDTLPPTRGALVDALVGRLLPGLAVTPAHRAALLGFLGPDGPLRSGDTTWQFPVLVAMVLDAPYWSVR